MFIMKGIAAMAYEVPHLDQAKRAAAKQASRDEDARKLADGEMSPAEMRRKNSFFGAMSLGGFKMVAIGGKLIGKKGVSE